MRNTQPDIRPVSESGEIYVLFADWTFSVTIKGEARSFLVRKGFRYDGASVPRIVWTLLGFLPDGVHRAAALAHDFLYESKGVYGDFRYDKLYADRVFLALMKEFGVKAWHSRIAYLGVRAFGRVKWLD